MGGGLMQLVASGAQDIYLTGNPQMTFFKVVYKRHTNFSIESIQQTFSGNADFGGAVSATISRNGDLLYRMYLEHNIYLATPSSSGGNDHMHMGCDYGSHVIKQCDLEIGGQLIDRHYGHWHSVYHQLTEFNPTGGGEAPKLETDTALKGSGVTLYNNMTGNGFGFEAGTPYFDNSAAVSYRGWTRSAGANGGDSNAEYARINGRFWIPLYFWFCRNPGLALPLIALQYHEVKVKMNFENINQLLVVSQRGTHAAGCELATNETARSTTNGVIDSQQASTEGQLAKSFDLWCDYIYLDTDERRRFAQVSHEYLIEQVQFNSYSNTTNFKLVFNHPVKELIWTGTRIKLTSSNTPKMDPNSGLAEDATNHEQHLFARGQEDISDLNTATHRPPDNGPYKGEKWILKLNGHDRFSKRDYRYFTRTQIWQHHTGYGGNNVEQDTIAVYSFALKPEEHQPSGTCNFSRIDNAQLISDSPTVLNIYAVNYNVLRIMSGMGGLAYSN
tara:strand:- start:379 stop:1881 length:1503 start_codon:yes stop_codon:yes gene_type:complete